MPRSFTLLIPVLACVAAAAAVPRAQGDRSARPEPSGTARISGRLVAADTGESMKRVSVRLASNALSRQADTDDGGRFEFPNLPAGYYSIIIDWGNLFVPPRQPRSVVLADGGVEDMTIRLTRTGVIEGRVKDENGVAVIRGLVRALLINDFAGRLTAREAGSTATDDRGSFRLFNLPPGEYYLVAGPGYARADRTLSEGYTPTYYPSAPGADGAKRISVRAGQESPPVEITLVPSPLAQLRIEAIDSQGLPLTSNAQVSLSRADRVYRGDLISASKREDGGVFLFANVAPGAYTLLVNKEGRMEEAAWVPVTLRGGENSLRVQTNVGATLSGRIVIEGTPRPGIPPRVRLAAIKPPGTYGVTYAREPHVDVQGTDRFTLTGLRGRMMLYASLYQATLKSIRREGQEIGPTLDFIGTEAIGDVEVVFTMDVAEVDVRVVRTSGDEGPEPVLVVLFAADPGLWNGDRLRYWTGTVSRSKASAAGDSSSAQEGTVANLIGLVPGKYLVAAVPDPEIDHPTDTKILDVLQRVAVPVTLETGRKNSVRVNVVPLLK